MTKPRYVSSTAFDGDRLALEETLYHTANGYLGVRAAFEEGYAPGSGAAGVRGTYVNAFYDTHLISHPEKLYGFPETGERIVAAVDAQGIEFFADGERMVLESGRLERFERSLDLDRGVARRSFVWRTARGKRLELSISRLCSLEWRSLFAVEYRVRSLDADVDLALVSVLDGDVRNHSDESDPRLAGGVFKPLSVLEASARPPAESADAGGDSTSGELLVRARTGGTGFELAVLGLVRATGEASWRARSGAARAELEVTLALRAGRELALTRKTIYADSIRFPDPLAEARRVASEIAQLGFAQIEEAQATHVARFWEISEARIEGDPRTEEGMRFGLFQLLQAKVADGVSSIPAKGLSGEGYEGHYFWDSEIYLAPFFTYTDPAAARRLLEFRRSILDGARRHARDMGHARGAAYPWRTIAGRECSAYYPSGSAQYHINADIAYAYWRYFEATDDYDFLARSGAEVLFETARIWLELGHFDDGEFRIESVTGPDEYTCLVDNNFYTNAMAAFNLRAAGAARRVLAKRDPTTLTEIERRIGLGEEEPRLWERAAAEMYLPHDARRDLTPQDDGFLRKARWDLAGTPPEKRPLLLHYHHLTINRYQVCKQADAVLAHLLLPGVAAESTVRNSFLYYDAITTHDSSLSYAAFSAMAARLGYERKALRYFGENARIDLDDAHGNAKDGIHAAAMGGIWMALVFGFGGFRPAGKLVALDPLVPVNPLE
ncbi:MAG: family 65 glycosyl hydrolase [Spirochaetaceae bacterium]|nr:family 65 glycosyl hydrolase [Spirochaetaceae bacterium]